MRDTNPPLTKQWQGFWTVAVAAIAHFSMCLPGFGGITDTYALDVHDIP